VVRRGQAALGNSDAGDVVDQRQAIEVADGFSDDIAACLGIPAILAHHCLFTDGPLNGRTVLVAGGPARSATTASRWPNGPVSRLSAPSAHWRKLTFRGRPKPAWSSTTAPETARQISRAVGHIDRIDVTLSFVQLVTAAHPALDSAAAGAAPAVKDGALTQLPVRAFSPDAIAAAHEGVEAARIGRTLVDLR
jgi:NADPH2:quinone reductase